MKNFFEDIYLYYFESRLYYFWHNRVLRIVCFFKDHDWSKTFYPYGIKAKICNRCFKYTYPPLTRKEKALLKKCLEKGEIGSICGVRFIETTNGKTR